MGPDYGMDPRLRLSYNDVESIVSDIGEEGWVRFRNEITEIPMDQRAMYFENFISKYKTVGQLAGQDAAVIYKSRRFTSKMPDEQMVLDKGRRGTLSYESMTIEKGKSEVKLEWKSSGDFPRSSMLDFKIERKVDEAGDTFEEISGIRFFGEPMQSGLLLNELLDKIPTNAIINESSLTYDSLYLLLRQAIKKNAKIVFHKKNPKTPSAIARRRKQSSQVSRKSKWSHQFETAKDLYAETGDPRHIDRAVNEIMDEFRGMIGKYAKKHPERVVGRPELQAIKDPAGEYLSYGADPTEFTQRGSIEYNFISIHKMTAALAGILGYKNKEEFMKFLSYDPESMEAQVFDSEFSF